MAKTTIPNQADSIVSSRHRPLRNQAAAQGVPQHRRSRTPRSPPQVVALRLARNLTRIRIARRRFPVPSRPHSTQFCQCSSHLLTTRIRELHVRLGEPHSLPPDASRFEAQTATRSPRILHRHVPPAAEPPGVHPTVSMGRSPAAGRTPAAHRSGIPLSTCRTSKVRPWIGLSYRGTTRRRINGLLTRVHIHRIPIWLQFRWIHDSNLCNTRIESRRSWCNVISQSLTRPSWDADSASRNARQYLAIRPDNS